MEQEISLSSVTTKRKIESESEVQNKHLKTSDEISTESQAGPVSSETTEIVRKPRKLRKVVMLLCYLGKNYFGMQRNNGVITVEEDLLKALLKAGVILQDECDCPRNMKFQRAARTDKGVSAVRQIVSLKIPQAEITRSFPDKVNQYLPPEVRVICVRKVTQGFDAKLTCDARTYSYMLPTFAFCDNAEDFEDYRITSDRINEVRKFLEFYLGTHNYYNFTSGREASDPSCNRFIMSCECSEAFVQNGLEFCVIRLKGQSFMLHQIRKMVGLAIAVMRKLATEEVLKKAWDKKRVDIPKAPGLGLMLEEVHYEWYNKKYGGDGMHEALTWGEYQDVINDFKRNQIQYNIAVTEKCEKSMLQWLETLPYHTYDIREEGPPSFISSEEPKAENVSLDENKTESVSLEENKTESVSLEADKTESVLLEESKAENVCSK